ncbi:hypothetical protein JTB14_019698 [Gonioctena quinquepunctata]|nr:hypothetical protein JTB14_019698 [Gonioctena quinquepunctata]
MQCPGALYKSFRSYCQDRYANLSCPTGKISKCLTKGCPQGSVCGPVFWVIMLEELLEQLSMAVDALGTVAYADDLLILVEAESRRELERKGDNVLNIVHRWCGKVKLNISIEKTTYNIIKGQLNRDPQLRIDGRLVKRTKKVRYLGLIMDESRMFAYHITDVCERATTTMHRITSLVQREVRIPFRQVRLYLSVVLASIAGYSASVWVHRLQNIKNREKVDRTQRGFLVRMTGSFGTTATQALTTLVGVLPMQLEIKKRAALYWVRRADPARAQAIVGREIRTKRDVHKEIANLWQEMWSNSEKARRVYETFPNLDRIPPYFNPTPGLVHFITGHGTYPQYLNRFNQRDNSLCEYGEEGTPEHVVLECLRYEDRENLRGRIRGRNLREIIENQDTYNNEQNEDLNDEENEDSKKEERKRKKQERKRSARPTRVEKFRTRVCGSPNCHPMEEVDAHVCRPGEGGGQKVKCMQPACEKQKHQVTVNAS